MKVHLNTHIKKVKSIVHCADIHIRLFKRHAEYKQVFETFYQSIKDKKLEDFVIVVAGDIVHAKTDMSPEMVSLASSFLSNLADIAPTIIIAGNHDLNLANKNRLDALTPIIQNLNHRNLYYFRESGVYQFANIEFGVFSIIDDESDWPSIDEFSTDSVKIGLYHGPMNKARTDVGYTITNKLVPENFDGFDIVMLGDIHRAQFIQERDGLNKPDIAYPGSLIQQNHGELLTGHGYYIWNIEETKCEEYVEVPNDYGYCTVRLESTKIPLINDAPKHIRLRVLVGDIDTTTVHKAVAILRKKYNIAELSVNRLLENDSGRRMSIYNNVYDDIHTVTHQNELIQSYIKNWMPATAPETVERVMNINTSLNAQIGEDELPKNIRWHPISLKFDNLFSYGKDNHIEFDGMKGLYGLFSANATGKTSAFDALCFALYDKTPRAFKGSHIMNTREDEMSCELKFMIGDKTYGIIRRGTRKKNGEVKVDVNFFQYNGDEQVSLNGEDRRDTNANIRSYVGSYEDFILTNLSVQNQNSLFIDTGQSDRKDLLSQFIGLTVFDRLYTLALDQIKEVAGELKSFRKDDFTQRLASIQTEIESLTKEHKSLGDDARLVRNEMSANVLTTKKLLESKTPDVKLIDIVSLKARIDKCESELAELYKLSASKDIELTALCTPMKPSKPYQKKFEPESDWIPSVKKNKQLAENRLLVNKTTMAKLESELTHVRERIKELSARKFNPECPVCIDNNKSGIHEYDQLIERISQINESYNETQLAIIEAQEILDDCNEELQFYDNYKMLVSKYFEQIRKIESVQSQKDKCELTIASLHVELDKLTNEANQYETNKLLIESNKKIDEEIHELDFTNSKLQKQLSTMDNQLQSLHGKIEVRKSQLDDILQSVKKAEELETTYEAYEAYLNVIGRDGLPYELLTKIIPHIESEVNNILTQVVDFTISLDMDGKNINGYIIYDDQRQWPLELASGMEKFITSLSIRVALMSVSNLPKSNFLIIDEGLGVLDADNLSSMTTMFNILKSQFEFIILISHLEAVRDITDNLIEIRREDGYSQIEIAA